MTTTITETTAVLPTRRSRKARRAWAAQARQCLRQYDAATYGEDADEASEARVLRLLAAQACISRALAMETRRALGDPYATALSERDAYRDAR